MYLVGTEALEEAYLIVFKHATHRICDTLILVNLHTLVICGVLYRLKKIFYQLFLKCYVSEMIIFIKLAKLKIGG